LTPLSSVITGASGIGVPSKRRGNANWFGVKLGKEETTRSTVVVSDGAGVGKYLNLSSETGAKRSADPGIAEDLKKKGSLEFGN
jgi:hypothetical protein